MTPLEQHKADLESIIKACGAGWPAQNVMWLAESLLVRLPEESDCANHPADQICAECAH